jgi:hypothetical protein
MLSNPGMPSNPGMLSNPGGHGMLAT